MSLPGFSRFVEWSCDLSALTSAPVDAYFHQKEGTTMDWDRVFQELQMRGWRLTPNDQWVDVEAPGKEMELATFRRDEQGLKEAQQFLEQVRHGSCELPTDNVSLAVEQMHRLVEREREAGPGNDLTAFYRGQRRRDVLNRHWEHIQAELSQIKQAINSLPALPVGEEIRWAQTVLAMNDLAFLEIDTTGLHQEDEITRVTFLSDGGLQLADIFINPGQRQLSAEASTASGIQSAQLEQGISIELAWEQIRDALAGRYVISFGLEWDLQQLRKASERHHLEPILVIGDCLQRHATRYYHGEYYLKLEELCARMGSPLPAKPAQTSIHRASGQYAVLQAMAQAITDLREPGPEREDTPVSTGEGTDADFDPFLDTDDF